MLAAERVHLSVGPPADANRCLWLRAQPTSPTPAYGRQLAGWNALGELGQLPGLSSVEMIAKSIFYVSVGTAIITVSIFAFRIFDLIFGT